MDRRFHDVDSSVVVRPGEIVWVDKESITDEATYRVKGPSDFFWLWLLRIGVPKGDGKTCPHKGAVLSPGCKRCPFHGLPNPIPSIDDVTVDLIGSGSAVLGSVRLRDVTLPTLQITVETEGMLTEIRAYGITIHKISSYVRQGDTVKVTMNVN